jgi:hypothetical protein
MDTSFTFPSVRAANPPATLLETLAEILPQDTLPDPIRIHNPLSLDNIPNTDIARLVVQSLARVREGLCSPFNTPDAILPRRLWLELVLEVLASVHEGLRNAQLASPLAHTDIHESDAFDLMDGDEVALVTKSYEILGWLKDFFQEDGDTYGDAERLHCSRCVLSGYATQSKDAEALSKSLQLTNSIDARAFRESLLNKVLPSIHRDVDEWRVRQRGLLIDHVVQLITDPSSELSADAIAKATHVLDDRVRTWVDTKRSEIQAYARSCITNEACENTVDLWAHEAVIHRIDARRREIDQQTDELFDAKGIAHRREQRLAELTAAADETIAAESARLDEFVARRVAELRHDAKVKVFDAENDAHAHELTSAIRSAKPHKPSPISSRTRSKGKGARKSRILDLHSNTSGAESETPMTTEDEGPASPTPAPHLPDSISPAEPTPKAHTFPHSGTPSPPSRPTSTTPTGHPSTIPAGPPLALTPPREPASELTMVLAALSNMKTSLSEEINKVNARVDQLILNPPGIIPSSQPFEDFGDFSLPTAEECMEAEDTSRYTTIQEDITMENLYFDLAQILVSSGRCPAIHDHDLFADFLSRFLRELNWPLAPDSFTADQLDHCARLWNARCSEEALILKEAQDRDLFDDLFGGQAPRSADDMRKFSAHIDQFCSKYRKSRPLLESDFVFIKEFLTNPTPADPTPKPVAKVRFSEPPIATLNKPHTPPSPAIPTPEDFPALASKPFGDSWTTVTKRGKKKKGPQPPSQTPAATAPAPVATTTPNPNAPSFAKAAASTSSSTSKPQVLKPRVPDALRTTRYSIILNHSRPDIREMLGIDANRIFRTIRADLEKVNAPLTLLAGHWSSAVINKNFILTFAGLQKRDDIAKYDAVLFRPFGPDCRGAPTARYRSVLLSGVPLVRDAAGHLPSPLELDQEIGRNAAFKGVLSLAPPRWLYNPANIDPNRRSSSVIIAFYDPDRKVFDMITKSRTAVAMFGSFVTARPFENRPSFSQCSRCLHLGHSVERCNRPSSLVVCPSCGGPHKAHEHAFRCPTSQTHRGRQCSCPPRCFLCIERKHKLKGEGHNALSHSCPLRALYRSVAADPSAPTRRPSVSDGDAPFPGSSADTIPPTPGADGPFTLASDSKCETLVALHCHGASTEEMCRSILSTEQLTDLSSVSQ